MTLSTYYSFGELDVDSHFQTEPSRFDLRFSEPGPFWLKIFFRPDDLISTNILTGDFKLFNIQYDNDACWVI